MGKRCSWSSSSSELVCLGGCQHRTVMILSEVGRTRYTSVGVNLELVLALEEFQSRFVDDLVQGVSSS